MNAGKKKDDEVWSNLFQKWRGCFCGENRDEELSFVLLYVRWRDCVLLLMGEEWF